MFWQAKYVNVWFNLQVREIFNNLPDEIKVKLPIGPPPPGFYEIPEEVREKIRKIHMEPALNIHQKYRKVKELIESQPDDIRSKLPPLPPPPPVPPMPLPGPRTFP